MKLTAHLFLLQKWLLNPKDLAWFRQRIPSGVKFDETDKDYFVSYCFENIGNSADYQACVEHLSRIGMKRMPQKVYDEQLEHPERTQGLYRLDILRSFSPQECAKSEYVVLFWTQFDVGAGCQDDPATGVCVDMGQLYYEGEQKVQELFVAGRLPFFRLNDDSLAVSEKGKQLFESSGLTGFSITRRLPIIGRHAGDVKGAYWHLDLPVVVPESAQTRWLGPDGTVYAGRWVPGAVLAHDGYHTFDRAALKAVGFPDLFRREPHVDPRDARRPNQFILGSHRFFEFCKANKLKCDWEPVKLTD